MSDAVQFPRKLRCPFDAGWCPVVSSVPADERFTILYTWCPYCQVLTADAFANDGGELEPVAWFGYDFTREQYFPWDTGLGDHGTRWGEFAAGHLPTAEKLTALRRRSQGPQIDPTDNPPKDG
jgi:hypothetical protein